MKHTSHNTSKRTSCFHKTAYNKDRGVGEGESRLHETPCDACREEEEMPVTVYDEEEMKEVIKGFTDAYKIAARSTIAMVGFIVLIIALALGAIVWLALILHRPEAVPAPQPAPSATIYFGGNVSVQGDMNLDTDPK